MTEELLIQKGFVKDGNGNWSKPKRQEADFFNGFSAGGCSQQGKTGDSKPKGETGNEIRHDPVLEQSAGAGTLGKTRIQKCSRPGVLVRVTSIRKRLLDEDNLCEKYVVDLLRNSGVIHDDAPDKTRIEVCQRKAEKGESEFNLIEVFELCP